MLVTGGRPGRSLAHSFASFNVSNRCAVLMRWSSSSLHSALRTARSIPVMVAGLVVVLPEERTILGIVLGGLRGALSRNGGFQHHQFGFAFGGFVAHAQQRP